MINGIVKDQNSELYIFLIIYQQEHLVQIMFTSIAFSVFENISESIIDFINTFLDIKYIFHRQIFRPILY